MFPNSFPEAAGCKDMSQTGFSTLGVTSSSRNSMR